MIGIHECQGLIGLHYLTAANWGGKYVGIMKKTWVIAYMAVEDNHPVIDYLRELGLYTPYPKPVCQWRTANSS